MDGIFTAPRGDLEHSDNKKSSCIGSWSVCEGPTALRERLRVLEMKSV